MILALVFFSNVLTGGLNNELMGLEIDGQWTDKVPTVKKAIKDHFQHLFCEEEWASPVLDGIEFKKLQDQCSSLVSRIDVGVAKVRVGSGRVSGHLGSGSERVRV